MSPTGFIIESEPPAAIRVASPRCIVLNATPSACVADAQADVTVQLFPWSPNFLAIKPAALSELFRMIDSL